MTPSARALARAKSRLDRLGVVVRPEEPLSRYTSFRIGGPADLLVVATSREHLAMAARAALAEELPLTLVGGGTNLLVADEGVDGMVVVVGCADWRLEPVDDGVVLVAQAGCPLASLATRLARRGLAGLEWAANVPGTIGGAAVDNAGAFGGAMADVLDHVVALGAEGVETTLPRDELAMTYRSTRLKRGELGPVAVLDVAVRLWPGDAAALAERVRAIQRQRRATQPLGWSAGSTFTNPVGDFAGRLIEAAGLKGARVGGAQISPQHANFILNLGDARASDVLALMRHAQEAVFQRAGVWLQPEIQLVGRWSPEAARSLAGPAEPVRDL